MSVEVMSQVFKRYPNGGGEMLLALALADHADDLGCNVFPSVQRLAEKTRQSLRTVQYQLRKMEAEGWLVLVSSGGKGAGDTREYQINSDWLSGVDFSDLPKAEKQNKGANFAPLEGCNPEQIRVQSGANKGAIAVAPESSDNHQRNTTTRTRARDARETAEVFVLQKPNPPDDPDEISWDAGQKIFTNIPAAQFEAWESAFPKLDIDAELTRIELWYDANPKKRKRHVRRFITNWLSRAHQRLTQPKQFQAIGKSVHPQQAVRR